MNAPSVHPFPFAALPSVSREEIALARRARALSRTIDLEAVATALSELAGEAVTITTTRARTLDLTTIPAAGIAVAFAPADAPGMGRAAVVELELPLANALVTRALRQRVPRVTDSSRSSSPEIAGAVAALVHAALRRALPKDTLGVRVVAAGPASALVRDLAGVHHRVATLGLTVRIVDEVFEARVAIPVSELPPTHAIDAGSGGEIERLGDVTIGLPLVVATCIAGRAELAGLRPGDALLMPRARGNAGTDEEKAELTTAADGRLLGPITLAPARSERGLTGVLAEGGVLRTGAVASLSWDRPIDSGSGVPAHERTDSPMSGEGNTSPTLEVLEDAPVVVRVELGVVEMKARDWAALAPGDVVTLGRKLGDPASLRVGGVEIARGELVQVDGEYGVRIVATSMAADRGRARSGGT